MSFRDKAKKMREDLQKRTQESIDRGEDMPEYGSIFIKDNIPDGVGFWRPDFDDHLIDVIPFFAGENHPRVPPGRLAMNVDLWVHQNIGPNYDHFVCPLRMFKKSDPICDYIRKGRDGERLPKKEWEAIRPMRRCYYLVWVHDTPEEEEKGLQIWDVAWYNSHRHVDEIAKSPKRGGVVEFTDWDRGKSIAFSMKKSGKFTDASGKERDSTEFVGHRFVDRDEKLPDEILEQSFPLDDAITIYPETSAIAESFMGQVDDAGTLEQTSESQPASDDNEKEDPKQHGEPDDEPDIEVPEADFECPGGGTPGLDIEKLPECAKCPHYDPCSDLADSVGTPPATETEKAEPKESEKKERKRIVRRRR